MKKIVILVLIQTLIKSCLPHGDENRENGKIFHAYVAPADAVGGLYFGLFNDHTYQICTTGGFGQFCYSGNYILKNDTLTLLDLSKEINLKSNKLLISRYSTMDSSEDLGTVFQIDLNANRSLGENAEYFTITFDSLQNSR